MWYFVLYVLLAAWVLWDAYQRKNHMIGWPIGTAVLGPIVLPFYLAYRNLGPGESREGGRGWNVVKYFALFWTATMAVAGFSGLIAAGQVTAQAQSEAEQTGAAIGTVLGMGLLFGLWFVVMAGALVLGLFLKKSTVEEGPSEPLKEISADGQQAAVGAPRWAGITTGAVAVLVALVVASVPDLASSESGSQGSAANDASATYAEYQRIEQGMTYDEVVEIIGSEGEELSRTEIMGDETVMYQWDGESGIGANMNVTIGNNRVVSKTQFGLE